MNKVPEKVRFYGILFFLILKAFVVIGDSNGYLKIYNNSNSSSLSLVNSFQGHSSNIRKIKQSPFNSTSNFVATCSSDTIAKIWKPLLNWTLMRTYADHSTIVYALEWLDSDTLASSGYTKRTIRILSLTSGPYSN